MLKLRRIIYLFTLTLLLSISSGDANAGEPSSGIAVAAVPSEPTECPPIQNDHDVWPYELQDPPHKSEAPKGPEQITDTTRSHHAGPKPRGAGYCLYSPPSSARGLILLLHGWQVGIEAGQYDSMAQFLAKNGFYVVYPYVADVNKDTGVYPERAGAALKHALSQLKSKNGAIKNVAVVGHSLGALTAVRLAARWKALTGRSAPPDALVLLEPEGSEKVVLDWLRLAAFVSQPFSSEQWDFSPKALNSIACETRLLIIQAQSTAEKPTDGYVDGLPTAQLFWKNLRQIAKYAGSRGSAPPVPKRSFLRVRDDTSRAGIVLPSTHLAPIVLPRVLCALLANRKDDYGCYLTSMKFYGYWQPTLAAVHEAFTGKPLYPNYSPYCIEGTAGACAKTRDMGDWQSDGKPATPMLTAAEIPELVKKYPDYCKK